MPPPEWIRFAAVLDSDQGVVQPLPAIVEGEGPAFVGVGDLLDPGDHGCRAACRRSLQIVEFLDEVHSGETQPRPTTAAAAAALVLSLFAPRGTAAATAALSGIPVHVFTVNDYLARRDSEWMGPLYEFHGLTVDCIDKHQPNSADRRKAYNCDITFGTNNEFGFDYLRDNMSLNP